MAEASHDAHGSNALDQGAGSALEERFLAHHFEDLPKQAHAARLGMWLFLATEILLFGVLFVGYSTYRNLFPAGFAAASGLLSRELGLVDTYVLVTSSFTMAMAIHWVHQGKKNIATIALGVTIALGFLFLVIHSYEYFKDYSEGALPGKFYHVEEAMVPGASMFYTLYFVMTGLHSLHVIIGAGVLCVIMYRTWRGYYSAGYDTGIELGGMYWHLIDLIWIFLYPLLYLV